MKEIGRILFRAWPGRYIDLNKRGAFDLLLARALRLCGRERA